MLHITRSLPLALSALVLAACSSAPALDPIVRPVSEAQRAAMTPADALAALKAGNLRFVSGEERTRDWKSDVEETADGAAPFAAVMTTCDARIVLPRALDQGLGDVVAVRSLACAPTAGAIAALEDAVERQGVKQIVVLVHKGCDECGPGRLPEEAVALYRRAAANAGDVAQRILELDEDDARQIGYARGVLKSALDRSDVLRAAVDGGAVGAAVGHYDLGTGAIVWL